MLEKRSIKLLLVEDNDDHASLIIGIINSTGDMHQIARVSNGEEALSYLDSASGSKDKWPDVVMLDMKMPFLNGIETLTEIRRRERLNDLPVVMVSTSDSRQEIQSAFQSGANSYIVKPLQFDELKIKIRDFVHYWSEISETPGFRVL